MAVKSLRVLPLGGLGEIGKNMTVVEYDGRIAIVDAGLMFPTAEMLGIDLVLPDFGYLRDRVRDIEGLVLTHGHEDHVGAVPYLLREVEIPAIYGGRLTSGMVRSKLDEHGLGDAPVEAIEPGEQVELGPFELETVHLTHSIPDSTGVVVRCELGSVLITGDYKFDQTPVDGVPADMTRLSQIGEEGLLLLCGDSTNSDRRGITESESSVGPALEALFARCTGRIVVTSFASNVHRVQQVIDAAANLNKKVAVVGRSMRKYLNVARNLGHADVPEGLLIPTSEIESFPDDEVVIVSTGSQGEPLSALRRMAHHEHRKVTLHSGDTVVFSATPVPGNEMAVSETIDRLYQIGCDVITTKEAPIHASGHGCAEELKMMLNLTQPRYVMPVHGDHKRLTLHARLAESTGIDREHIFKGENGLPLEIDSKGARYVEKVQSSMIFVDGIGVGDVQDAALRDRHRLSSDGIFIVVATISRDDGTPVTEPEVIFRGVPFIEEGDEIVEDLRVTIDQVLKHAAADEIHEVSLLQELLHEDIAELVYEQLKRRPMILPVVIEV